MSYSLVIVNDMAAAFGGQTAVALETARLAAEAGRDVTYFAGGSARSPVLDHPRIRVRTLDQENILDDRNRARAFLRGLHNPRAAEELSRIVHEAPRDAVFHLNGWVRILSPSVLRVLRPVAERVVITLHDHFSFCPNGGYYNFQRQRHCGVRPLSAGCLASNCDSRIYPHKLWRYARHWKARLDGLASFRNYIAFSDRHAAFARPFLRAGAEIEVIENPVRLVQAPRVRAEKNAPLLFVGRLTPEKGPRLLAAAAREAGVPAVFVGTGREAERIRAENPEAILTGWLSPAEAAEWFSRARALVFPSRWPETFGLVLFEALGRGVPVVASDGIMMADTLDRSGGAVLFDGNRKGELARVLVTLGDDARVRNLSEQGYAAYWREPLSAERYFDRLDRTYRRLGGGPAA